MSGAQPTVASECRQVKVWDPKFILFDLDGTLVDTAPDLAYCVDAMMASLGMPMRGEDCVRMWIGNGAERLVKRALTGEMKGEPETALMARAFVKFNELYHLNTARSSRPYPAVIDTLEHLKSRAMPLGCITNKPRVFSERLLDELALSPYFRILVCGDDLPRKKPDPLPLEFAADRLGFTPQRGLLVGDSRSDVRAARAAGMPVVCVSGGYNHGEDVARYQPDAVLSDFASLLSVLATS